MARYQEAAQSCSLSGLGLDDVVSTAFSIPLRLLLACIMPHLCYAQACLPVHLCQGCHNHQQGSKSFHATQGLDSGRTDTEKWKRLALTLAKLSMWL
eukprot:scaffold36029_cov27-Tisochrysis_lutea.AAC.2